MTTKISKVPNKKLNQLAATAICGNDISSSVLYVSALAIGFAGQYAWITLLMVVFVLYLYRKIYGEVVGAIPLNGGAYNALLNTTSKKTASIAATLTVLSYIATAVISGNEAMHYLKQLIPSLHVLLASTVLLILFAGLVISGIRESSKVAIFIFLFHLVSLILLSSFIVFYLFSNGLGQFFENQSMPLQKGGSITNALFLGFAASMLGVSGFESSANFVEEQERGVFEKTLRNMWVIVSIINPLMAFFALSLFSLPVLQSSGYQNTLLSQMGNLVGDGWLASIISIDAVLVLSGAVLTSFVGSAGLLDRIALDRILPKYFLKKNSKGSSYRIIIFFLLLTISILWYTKGNVKLLAGVYSISFLSVMIMFGFGNILLKVKRAQLPRSERATWISVFIAIVTVGIALFGNIMMKPVGDSPSNLTVFLDYFIPTFLLIIIMLNRTTLLKFVLSAIKYVFDPIRKFVLFLNKSITSTIEEINMQEFVFFTKGDTLSNLNQVMIYIKENEHTKNIKIVTVLKSKADLPKRLEEEIKFLDEEYPDINVEFEILIDEFSPELVKRLSKKWKIPINFMFMGSPTTKFKYRVEEFAGVRLII